MNNKAKDQVLGSTINEINKNRILREMEAINLQDEAFDNALKEVDNIREFLGSPENILGSDKTKHGEVAEQVEVGIRRARDILNQSKPAATFETVGRTAPEDYIIDGINVQSKFINGTNNNLTHVLNHIDKYQEFGRDSSYYHIPKDSYQMIEKIIKGENIEGVKSSTQRAILEKVKEIEVKSGKNFEEVIRPSMSNYDEIQLGKISETLDRHENDLLNENIEKKQIIKQKHKPNLNEGLRATGTAAVVGGGISLVTELYKKSKEGKKFYSGDFTYNDWKEVGIETVKGSEVGVITGAGIYALTNYANLSAPFASAAVSAFKGVNSLVNDYNHGKITQEELIELGLIVCGESAVVGIATAVGQTLIPIPVVGAVIGSIAGSMLCYIINPNKETAKMIKNKIENSLRELDRKYEKIINEIVEKYKKLGELTTAAFDLKNNMRLLESSIELARLHEVEEERIIKSIDELDSFMML